METSEHNTDTCQETQCMDCEDVFHDDWLSGVEKAIAPRTVETDLLKETANRMLAMSADCLHESRDGIFLLVENVLMDSGQYRGFKFTSLTDPSRKKFC